MPRSVKKCLEPWENLDQCRPPECDRTLNTSQKRYAEQFAHKSLGKGFKDQGNMQVSGGQKSGQGKLPEHDLEWQSWKEERW